MYDQKEWKQYLDKTFGTVEQGDKIQFCHIQERKVVCSGDCRECLSETKGEG